MIVYMPVKTFWTMFGAQVMCL